ncbi:MFS transporter [Metabacillus iocasae]|uniref:DHA1 family purine base/nucleoside efflux pump-like MFS transporter n=1 Tax=Priestia iocasae TaxID=2291674 RepID=A0ABS2QWM1_9BACI|nr:MFS transporter [Metabacillus iocasae]MBM7703608.1 DHA1 family purine base/nucleoside efflux pump-like MFS transporter [Metabacillus iocasae]
MNNKVYILAIASFVVGTVELILGGILDVIANAFNVTISQAGYLISIYSIVFAIAAPILLHVTAKVERKKVYVWTLAFFLLSNILSALSMTYAMLLISRVFGAISGSFLIVLSTTLAARLVKPEYQGRALGTVFMGISASLVLGIPMGIYIGNTFGWREVFIMIAVLTGLILIAVIIMMERLAPAPVVPLKKQFQALKDSKMIAIHLTTFFLLAGHLTLYAYFTPFLKTTLGLHSTTITIVYAIFGVAAVIGGGIGGWAADKWTPQLAITVMISMFFITMVSIPFGVKLPFILFLLIMIVWSSLSWAISPALNNYIIQSAPNTSDILISTNSSISHLGIALGSYIGGIVIHNGSVMYNSWAGSILILGALLSIIVSTRTSSVKSVVNMNE